MARSPATVIAGIAGAVGSPASRPRPLDGVLAASTAGTGSLPHRNADAAARFALGAYDLATVPHLPRRSPAESPIAQALVGVPGVTLGQYGTVAIDPARLDPDAPVVTDLDRDGFVGARTFLDAATEHAYAGPVVWHFAGPISVGLSLLRAGAAADVAFRVACHAVRSHTLALAAAVNAAIPGAPQIVFLDEPLADRIMERDLPITPDEIVDVLSSAMAAVERFAAVGVHCCADIDLALLLEAGPHILSLPVSSSVEPLAGYLDRFLARDGWIAWGAVATEGPIGVTANRSWHHLAHVWGRLGARGCDLERVQRQCILTPQCGLGAHGVGTAERICRTLHDVARVARSDAARTQLLLGV
jgi:hypothetical protein